MKSYIRERPPGWNRRPDQPVIIVSGEEEKKVRENLYAVSDFWRYKVRRRADQILNRNKWASRVDICDAKGEVIRSVKREVRTEEPWPATLQETIEPRGGQTEPSDALRKKPPTPELVKKDSSISASKKRGRPRGKRSDPNFTQITAYLRAKTIDEVKVKLIQQGSKQDTSELIEKLLSAWLRA